MLRLILASCPYPVSGRNAFADSREVPMGSVNDWGSAYQVSHLPRPPGGSRRSLGRQSLLVIAVYCSTREQSLLVTFPIWKRARSTNASARALVVILEKRDSWEIVSYARDCLVLQPSQQTQLRHFARFLRIIDSQEGKP